MPENLLPVLTILVPAVASIIVYAGGRYTRLLLEAFSLLASAATVVLAAGVCYATFTTAGTTELVWKTGTFVALRIDALSAIMVALIATLSFLVVIYSTRHIRSLVSAGKVDRQRLPLFYGLTLLFTATMLWACTTDNIIVLFIAVEATTLASALLVTFYWNKRALEAGYKYLLLLTVGITFALFGCVLIYAAHSGYAPGQHWDAMMLSNIQQHAAGIAKQAPSMLILATAFLIIGFGTKTGLMPFHPWLPDAHAEAPSPVSVLLSGIVIKVGAYAIARTVVPFINVLPALQIVLLVFGAITMFIGIIIVAAQDDLKRLLAYSSVSQIGYIIMGFGFGTYLGFFGAVYHILNHALAKSALFLGAGAIEQSTGTRNLSKLGGLARKMPVTAACFVIACMALGGVPALNGFMSKITICLAGMAANYWWAAVIAVITGMLTLIVLARAAMAIFWGDENEEIPDDATEVPPTMYGVMIVLVLGCVALGVWPLLVSGALDQAALSMAPAAATKIAQSGF